MKTDIFIKAFNKAFDSVAKAKETKDGIEINIGHKTAEFDTDGTLIACLNQHKVKTDKANKATKKAQSRQNKPASKQSDDDGWGW